MQNEYMRYVERDWLDWMPGLLLC